MKGMECVTAALKAAGLRVSIVRLQDRARSAQLAADALGAALGSIVKSLVYLADGKPVLVLVAGDRRAAPARLKGLPGMRRAMITDADRVQRETGLRVGAVPPISHRKGLPVWIDASLNRFETIYAAAGHTDAVFNTF